MRDLQNENKDFSYTNENWIPIFSDAELHDVLERVILENPGHPLIAEPILIGKN
ncbi:hypothetical protein [Labilibacter marinus]|uniref:hypothetical protein n=1 Tax=Labilibacter marinus TaxID=1477105 RepID=UPI0013014787|nr:hypothetical protein [Labilibacter marinus]